MSVTEINDNDFQQKVLESSIPVLVDFWAPWCGPCKQLSPIIEELAEEMKESVSFCKIDIDQYSDHAGQFGVMSIPALMVFKNGTLVGNRVGASSKGQIQKWIVETIA